MNVLSAGELERLYALGHAAYGEGRLETAADVFAVLTMHEPTDPRSWFARGATAQRRDRLDEAVAAYSFAALLGPDDPWPFVHLGECLLRHGAGDVARGAFDRAIEQAGADECAAARAQALLGLMEVGDVH